MDASKKIPNPPKELKQPYITSETFGHINTRWNFPHLNADGLISYEKFKRYFKKCVRVDKRKYLSSKLTFDSKASPAEKWKTIKSLRTKYQPRPPCVFDHNGTLQPADRKQEILSEFLQNTVWCCDISSSPDLHVHISSQLQVEISCPPSLLSPFEEHELFFALSKFKNGKSTGSDQVKMEYIKWSSLTFKHAVLSLLNDCFLTGTVPREWNYALIAMLPKGGTKDLRNPDMYRPISLSQTMYRLYASVLKYRLQSLVEPFLRPTQYGFKPKRSTSQPIFILRRIIEKFERSGDSLHLLFLDWKKAFDSVNHIAVLKALQFFQVPEPLINAIMSLYTSISFNVKGSFAHRQQYSQHRGVRQGCPLSPLLFIMILSHIMHDIDFSLLQLNGSLPWIFSAECPLWDLEYADDTVVMARSGSLVERILHLLMKRADLVGLKLHSHKCEHLRLNSDYVVRDVHGEIIPQVKSVKI